MWNNYEIKTARHLIANMIGERDRSIEMGEIWNIDPEMFPLDMSFEAKVLDIILRLRAHGLAPNEQNICSNLMAYYNESEEEAREQLERLLEFQTVDRSVIPLTVALHDSIQHKERVRIGEKIAELTKDQRLSGQDFYSEIHQLVTKLAPIKSTAINYGLMELADTMLDMQHLNAQRAIDGTEVGPRFPWKESHDIIPFLIKRDMTVVSAKTGQGKTSFGLESAFYMAHKQGGYNVVYAHTETDPLQLMTRELSKRLLIPLNSILRGYHWVNGQKKYIDLSDEPFVDIIRDIKREWYTAEKEKGHLWFYHCPDANPQVMESELRKRKMQSDAEGRELVVFIDYFQAIAGGSEDAQTLNQYANDLKLMAERLNIYLIVLAQNIPEDDYSSLRDGYVVRYSKTLPARSQLVLRLESELADYKKMSNMNNYFGQPIVLHEEGQPDSDVKLRIVKGNNYPVNSTIDLIFLRQFFTVSSPPKQVVQGSF